MSTPEPDATITVDGRRTLAAAMSSLDQESVDHLAETAGSDAVGAALVALGLQLDPRFIRGGAGRLAYRRIAKRPADPRSQQALQHLISGVLSEAVSFLGDDFEDPSGEQMEDLWFSLCERHGVPVATVVFAWVVAGNLTAAAHAHSILEDHAPATLVAPNTPLQDQPIEQGEEAEDQDEAPWVGIGDAAVFSPLDEMLIRTIMDAVNGTVGVPALDDVHLMIDELIRLNSARQRSWFHAGLLDALDDERDVELPEAALNEERRRWLLAGQLRGYIRREQADRLDTVDRHDPDLMLDVLTLPHTGRGVWGHVIDMMLEVRPLRAAELLRTWEPALYSDQRTAALLLRVHMRARHLLVADRVAEARALWDAIQDVSNLLPGTAHWWGEIPRWLSACARADNDFARAGRILQSAPEPDDAAQQALLRTEQGLVTAEIAHLRNVTLARSGDHIEALASRLRRGVSDFEAALAIDGNEWRARACLGVLARVEGRHREAVTHLSVALEGMADDPRVAASGLVHEMRFHLGVAKLACLEPGDDGPAYGLLKAALSEGGFKPPVELAEEVLELLATHRSPFAGEWLGQLVDRERARTRWARHAVALLDAGDRTCRETASALARSARVDPLARFNLVSALIEHADDLSEGEIDDLIYELEELVRSLNHVDVTRAWGKWLNGSTATRLLDGTQARLAEADAHRDLGNTETAAALIESLIHPALSDPTGPLDPAELLELYRQLNPPEESLDHLTTLVERADQLDDNAATQRPVHVVFVGGNEEQARYDDDIDDILRRDHGGTITVEWIHPGWSTMWRRFADAAEAQFDQADVLVTMRFMRTNLGRRIRREAGKADLPWVQTPGHGREAVLRGILRGARLARQAMPSANSRD